MKIAGFCALAAALMIAGQLNALADAVLTVAPPAGPVLIGQVFTVAIEVTGPTVIHGGHQMPSGVSDLAAFQFDVAFNCTVAAANPTGCQPGASVLQAVSISEGSFLPNGGANSTFFEPGSIDNPVGEVALIGDVGAAGVNGSGDLVDLTFRALTPGTTDIAILANSDLQLYDSQSNPIVVDDSVTSSTGKQTFPTNQFLSAPVTATTPEPSSGLLLALGVILLAVFTAACARRNVPGGGIIQRRG